MGAWTHFISTHWIILNTNEIWPKCSEYSIVVFWSFPEPNCPFSSNDPQSTKRALIRNVNNGTAKRLKNWGWFQLSFYSNLTNSNCDCLHFVTLNAYSMNTKTEMITDFVLRIGNTIHSILDSEQRSYMFCTWNEEMHTYLSCMVWYFAIMFHVLTKWERAKKRQRKFMIIPTMVLGEWREREYNNSNALHMCYAWLFILGFMVIVERKEGKRADIRDITCVQSCMGTVW